MAKRLTESLAFTPQETGTPGRLLIQLITPGWGSSGYYSRQVLENAATDRVWPAGTHIYFDHPTESEQYERPERSVRDLAAILDEDAYVDTNGGLVAEARIIGPYRDLLTDDVFMDAVGMSIRATADTTVGEAEGRKGTIITRLIHGESVDIVTRAGRGGRILAAVESARAQLAAEAATDDVRDRLHRAVSAAYSGPDTFAYVMDFDPDRSVVWFDHDGRLYEQAYELTGDTAALAGDPVEVRRVVTYRPVTTAAEAALEPPVAPAGSTPNSESQEDTMPNIEEGLRAQLEEAEGRVSTLTTERDEAVTRAEAAEAAKRTAENRALAMEVIVESGHKFTTLERRGLMAELPTTDDGTLDVEAFTETVKTAAAEAAVAAGAGRVTGFGPDHVDDDSDAADVLAAAESAVAAAFGHTIKEA